MKLFLAVVVSVAALSAPVQARARSQDEKDSPLAALAKKTKKKSDSEETKVISGQDLRKTKSHVTIPPASASAARAGGEPAQDSAAAEGDAAPDGDAPTAAGAGEGEAAEPEKTPAELRAEQQAGLQEQVDQQRWLISELEKKKTQAQAELSDSATMVPGSQRRATLLQLVENCDTQIAEAQQKITDLQTQARRAGIAVR